MVNIIVYLIKLITTVIIYTVYIKGTSIVICDLSTDLQETVSSLLEEKKQLTCQLQDQQRQIEELTALVSSRATFELFTQMVVNGLQSVVF